MLGLCTAEVNLFMLLTPVKRHCIYLLILFPVFCSLTVTNISSFIKHKQSMHLSRGNSLNLILYLQRIVNHRVKMEAPAWPEISAPAHMVLWDQDVIQVSKRE